MFIRARKIGAETYYYLVESVREEGRIRQKTVEYFGADRSKALAYAKEHGLRIKEAETVLPPSGELDEMIRLKQERLAGLRKSPEAMRKLKSDLLETWTYNSTTIEGSTLNRRETALFLSEGIAAKDKPFVDHLDVKGHAEAVKLLFSWIEKDAGRQVNEHDILELHSTVMYGRRDALAIGAYRDVQVYIRGSAHLPPPPSEVPKLMKHLVGRIAENPDKHDLITHAAVTHADFEAIHPFVDGNGRVGRLVANWMLLRKGYPAVVIEVRDRKRYFSYLDAAHGGDYSKIAWFFKRKLNAAYDFYLKRLDPGWEAFAKSLRARFGNP